MRHLISWLLDTGPIVALALIAGAGSFTHIRDTASEHGQTGWMSWAIAICIDLMCVMAARERQRDKRTGRVRRGPISWPVLVLTGGIALSLAANLAQADPSVWGWITAATPAGAFLVAISMLERRASEGRPQDILQTSPAMGDVPEVPERSALARTDEEDDRPSLNPVLIDYARRVAREYTAAHGTPITRDVLHARLGVSHQLASDLLRTLRTDPALTA